MFVFSHRSLVNDIQSKAGSLSGGSGGSGVGTHHIEDLKKNINGLHTDVKSLVNRPSVSMAHRILHSDLVVNYVPNTLL